MPLEPAQKRAFVFVDGQNLFYAVKQAFGYAYPNFDPLLLAKSVTTKRGWPLVQTHFYTGMPEARDSAFCNYFWTAKLAVMGTRGIRTFSRHLKYRNQTVSIPGGGTTTVLVGQEKGVDVRLALDVVRFARENKYDVADKLPSTQVIQVFADSQSGNGGYYVPVQGSALNNWKLKAFTAGGTELSAGAYPASVTSDIVQITVTAGKLQ